MSDETGDTVLFRKFSDEKLVTIGPSSSESIVDVSDGESGGIFLS